jgi:hypothetical protein
MMLHHRPELENMYRAFSDYGHDHGSRDFDSSESGRSEGTGSIRSHATNTTAPTEYSASPQKTPCIHQNVGHREKDFGRDYPVTEAASYGAKDPRCSTTSTILDEEELEEQDWGLQDYEVPGSDAQLSQPRAIPATPSDFSHLFPSHRRMTIRHDDATLDGNMNLRMDTEVNLNGRKCDVTLFHLRMHDLKNREFSLRRYHRDSGREVCHSERKQAKTNVDLRPAFQRSLSNALNSMRPKSDSKTPTLSDLKRHDSGYGSLHSVESSELESTHSGEQEAQAQPPPSNVTIRLEFSNYAQVDVKCVGVKPHKRYEFEYWGKLFLLFAYSLRTATVIRHLHLQ